MIHRKMRSVLGLTFGLILALDTQARVTGWLDWRGPFQNGTSQEKGLPDKIDAKNALWVINLPGQSSPVIANGKLYINGFFGEGSELQEAIVCLDAETGKHLWDYRFNDFLSDVIYLRYATSSPTIDPETGNVYMQGTQGILACFTGDGKWLWEHSLMEEYGRMTFPNSRTASPIVDKDLVITRGITSNWGGQGAPGDRFYAFDKKTGELVWSATAGGRPHDNTFSHSVLSWWNGKRVLYTAAGDCSLVALNARTGDPIWRVLIAKSGAKGGVNAAVLPYGNTIVTVHESENLDSSEIGRMAAFKIPQSVTVTNPAEGAIYSPKQLETWRNGVGSLASSPVLVDDTVYEMSGTGDLCAVDAKSGKVLWKKKLGIEQRQSTPFYANGLLYVAMYISAQDAGAKGGAEAGTTGDFFVIKPGRDGCEILSQTQLQGKCYGSPVGFNGKLYIQTDHKLYCFGKAGNNPGLPPAPEEKAWPKGTAPARLQIIPAEVLLKPGGKASFRVRALDANGMLVQEDVKNVQWKSFIPPTALVKAEMKATFQNGELVAAEENVPSAGAFQATAAFDRGNASGLMRGRVLSYLPIKQDFESFKLSETTTNEVEPPTKFAYPPLPWIGARLRFDVREKDGSQALCKTIENKLLQRGTIFFGHSDMKNYTIEADVMTEGNRRKMSEIGVINQRYAIILKGNSQQLEISSNQERLREAVPFKITPNTWYHMKARVDVAADGSGMVRAKVWARGEQEPDKWVLEVAHKHAHPMGNPGLFSFAPQAQRTWIDNITVTAN